MSDKRSDSDFLHQALIIRDLRDERGHLNGAALAVLRADVATGTHDDHRPSLDPAATRARLLALGLGDMPPPTDDVAILLETLSQRLGGLGHAAGWKSIGIKPNRGRDLLARNARAVDWPIWKTLRDAALDDDAAARDLGTAFEQLRDKITNDDAPDES